MSEYVPFAHIAGEDFSLSSTAFDRLKHDADISRVKIDRFVIVKIQIVAQKFLFYEAPRHRQSGAELFGRPLVEW